MSVARGGVLRVAHFESRACAACDVCAPPFSARSLNIRLTSTLRAARVFACRLVDALVHSHAPDAIVVRTVQDKEVMPKNVAAS